jgi:hypothetical protein
MCSRLERGKFSRMRSTTMDQVKLIILPSESATRLVARDRSGATLLRACLPSEPWHTRALPRLLDGLGSFVPLHAALVVPAEAPSFATRLYPGWFADAGGDSYDLEIIGSRRSELRKWWSR